MIPRTYADDINAIARNMTVAAIRAGIKEVYDETQTYARLSGGEISVPKTYTFGDTRAHGAVPAVGHHVAGYSRRRERLWPLGW